MQGEEEVGECFGGVFLIFQTWTNFKELFFFRAQSWSNKTNKEKTLYSVVSSKCLLWMYFNAALCRRVGEERKREYERLRKGRSEREKGGRSEGGK